MITSCYIGVPNAIWLKIPLFTNMNMGWGQRRKVPADAIHLDYLVCMPVIKIVYVKLNVAQFSGTEIILRAAPSIQRSQELGSFNPGMHDP
jgi:hypothetical protein